MGPKLEVTGDLAFAIGTTLPVDGGITRFGVVTTGGIMTGVEMLSETDASGVFEGCAIGAGTGRI